MTSLTRELIRRLPKAELHVHLDGCLRPETMIALARNQRVRLPSNDPKTLADALFVRHAPDLESYLQRYSITVSVMQTREALERVAFEFVEDVARDNIRYVEVRFCPALHTSRLSLAQVMDAVLTGVRRGEAETGAVVRLIVCALRTLSPAVSDDLARAAVDHAGDGVVAFDLAGSERGHPAEHHAGAFRYARERGLARTCHAGEGDGPESVRQALHACDAQRLGHGTRLHEDADLEREVIARGIPLEACLTSNVHTHAVTDLARHPARRYLDMGGVVTLNTDSHLMDRTTLSDEYWQAHRLLGFDRTALDRVILNAFRSAFLPDEDKTRLIREIEAELREIR
jgi:adenosine deaminase